MADGLCTGEPLGNVIEKIQQHQQQQQRLQQQQRIVVVDVDSGGGVQATDVVDIDVRVAEFYDDDDGGGSSDCVELYQNLCGRRRLVADTITTTITSSNSSPMTTGTASGVCIDSSDSKSNNNNTSASSGCTTTIAIAHINNNNIGGSQKKQRHDVDITLDINMPASPADDDCRKKRCVDRYDSSESSDSGVAILSCTDCSGSSTASSDITDPGSPFSTASTHSEDSGNSNQPTKMPPTQNVHHPPWPWVSEEIPSAPCQQQSQLDEQKSSSASIVVVGGGVAQSPTTLIVQKEQMQLLPKQRQAVKRKETSSSTSSNSTQQKCFSNNLTTSNRNAQLTTANINNEPSPKKKAAIMITNNNNSNMTNNQQQHVSNNVTTIVPSGVIGGGNITTTTVTTELLVNGMDAKTFPRLQQGKITEYFKSQYKSSTMLKKELSNIMIKTINANPNSKFAKTSKLDVIVMPKKAIPRLHRSQQNLEKAQQVKTMQRTIPRKILPAPSKPDSSPLISMGQITSNNFPPIITTTLIPNVYTIQQAPQTKTPITKQQPTESTSSNIYVPQFALNDKLNAIPIVTTARGTPPLSLIQPLQKVTTINNFVKLNTSPSMMPTILKFHHSPHQHHQTNQQQNVINTAVPTVSSSVMSAIGKSIVNSSCTNVVTTVTRSHRSSNFETHLNLNGAHQCEQRLTSSSDDDGKQLQLMQVEETTRSQCPEELSPADSGVSSSLEVLINDEELLKESDKGQKSPILSQPKTIRFPAKERVVGPTKEQIQVRADRAGCLWDQCASQFDTNGALLEHLQVKHVISQATQEQYVCLWNGCKVHGRKSCSRSWLERHVLAHAGSKPFRCIVDGCGQRFNSQLALERHVNGHFNTDSTQSSNAKKSVENPSAKLYKRNGKKIRFRRQPWSARMFDFIDSGMMEGLQYRLLTMTEKRTNGQFDSTDGQTVTLSSQIMAKRVELDGTRKLLLRWHPNDIVDDEWISEKDYKKTQTVQIPRLQPAAKDNLRPILFPRSFNYCNSSNSSSSSSTCSSSSSSISSSSSSSSCTGRQKHRRKPLKLNT